MTNRFVEARRRLAGVIGPEGLAVIPAAHETIRNDDVTHPFRQDTSFWYLTGFHEPEAVAVIAPGHPDGEYTLFVRPKDKEKEIWTGIRAGTEGAVMDYAADGAYELGELDDVLERMMHGREVIWYATGNERFDDRIAAIVQKARAHREAMGGVAPSTVRDVSVPLGEMMLFKSVDEASSLRQACELTADGHNEAMRFAQPGMYEYQAQAALEYFWRLGGSPRNGYPSIVASGVNACILHYSDNDDLMDDGDLLLIDAAAEIDGYSSDVTRTFPVSGRFTGPQRAIYEVVLSAQTKCIELAVPGSSLKTITDESRRVVTEGLVDLGLLPIGPAESLSMHHYREFFMHGTSHWLGLDVHDRGSYRIEGKPRPLEPGMAFTVEPGIYVGPEKQQIELELLEYDPEDWNERRIRLGSKAAAALEKEEKANAEKITHDVPPEFLGIGVRIEDDILITQDGHEEMTIGVPKMIDEVEGMCAETSVLPTS